LAAYGRSHDHSCPWTRTGRKRGIPQRRVRRCDVCRGRGACRGHSNKATTMNLRILRSGTTPADAAPWCPERVMHVAGWFRPMADWWASATCGRAGAVVLTIQRRAARIRSRTTLNGAPASLLPGRAAVDFHVGRAGKRSSSGSDEPFSAAR